MMPSRVKEVHACMKKHERGMEKDRGERERERLSVSPVPGHLHRKSPRVALRAFQIFASCLGSSVDVDQSKLSTSRKPIEKLLTHAYYIQGSRRCRP